MRHALLVAIATLALPLAPAFAQNTAAGSDKDWNKVDEVEIVQPFKFADFEKIVDGALTNYGIGVWGRHARTAVEQHARTTIYNGAQIARRRSGNRSNAGVASRHHTIT